MAAPRTNHTATLLPDGRVLVVGGVRDNNTITSTAEIYDPGTVSFIQTGSMVDGRYSHSATLLGDGRVLVVGGVHSDAPLCCSDAVATVEAYP